MGKYKVRILRYLRDEHEYTVTAANWKEAEALAIARDERETPSINTVEYREAEWIEQAD